MKKFMVALGIMALLLALVASAWASAFEDFNDEAEFFYEQYYDTVYDQLDNEVTASSGTASAIIVNNSTNNTLLTQANCGNVITGNVAAESKADASGGNGGEGLTGGAGGVGGNASFSMGTSSNGNVNVDVSMTDVLKDFTGVGHNGQVVGLMNNQMNGLSFAVNTANNVAVTTGSLP
jgi:type II secretory pathway pseudopilin PulG